MFIPWLQREKSIDDFLDREESCRFSALLADVKSRSAEDQIYQEEVQGLVRRAFLQLDARERHIIRNRFGMLGGGELTLEEIGRGLGLSRERVRQVEREAKEKLRSALQRYQLQIRFSLA